MVKMRHIGMVVCALWLAACSGWGDAQTATVDGYTVSLQTRPAPLQVGKSAQLRVGLVRGSDGAATGCQVAFRQYMPGMEMSSDDVATLMEEQAGGSYSGASAEYSMGGDWQIEVKFACDGTERTATFNYHLEWVE